MSIARTKVRKQLLCAALLLLPTAGCFVGLDSQGLAQLTKVAKEARTGRSEDLEAFEPAPVDLPARADTSVTAFRVRIYADQEYRLGNKRWQEHIRALV